MALGPSSSAVHIQSASTGAGQPRTPNAVTLHPSALFSILDHYLRRTDAQPRVIGTLLGTRSQEGGAIVDVRTAFAVLHSETDEMVAVDRDYHQTMVDLYHKVNSREVIVGWYSTGSNLNTYSALIQNFYSQETGPHPAIHIALNTGTEEGETPGVKAYISSPVGIDPKPENCVFVPIPCELRFTDSERAGLDLLATTAVASSSTTSQPTTDFEILSRSLNQVSEMLDRVLTYVRSVLAGDVPGDAAIGRYLMDVLGAAPGQDDVERGGFNATLQDTLMVSYLANLVRSQAEVSARLALVSST